MSYVQLTTPLVLHNQPVLPSHPVNKGYIDAKKNSIPVESFTDGRVNILRLPALTGSVKSLVGTNELQLSDTGVVAGEYARVEVNTEGRVTKGMSLTQSDIVSVDFNKTDQDRPTTLAGYNIGNVIALSGGTVTGTLVSTATPTESKHAVTKGYADKAFTSASINTGRILKIASSTTPSGFIRCNGGSVNKIDYSELYAVLGESYATDSDSFFLPDFSTYEIEGICYFIKY